MPFLVAEAKPFGGDAGSRMTAARFGFLAAAIHAADISSLSERMAKNRRVDPVHRVAIASSTVLASTLRSPLTPSVRSPPTMLDDQLVMALIRSRSCLGGGKYSSSEITEISSVP